MYHGPLDLHLYLEKEVVYFSRDCSTNSEICEVKLVKKTKISPTAYLFVFGYSKEAKNALEVGIFGHFLFFGRLIEPRSPGFWNSVRLEDKDKEVKRKYTPIYVDVERKQIHFIIRIYEPCQEFPDGGRLSRFLNELKVEDIIKLIPWKPKYRLVEDNVIRTLGRRIEYTTLNLVAAGTGITPFVRLLIHHQNTLVKINLIYCNRSVEEILLKELFDRLASQNTNIKVKYLVYSSDECSSADVTDSSPDILNCKISREIVSQVLENSKKSATLCCGPPKFCDFVKELLGGLNFENCYVL